MTCGTFDLFHIGHLNILKRAKLLGDYLIVGVSGDELNYKKKGKYSVYSLNDRMEIIKNLKMVDEVFVEKSLEDKKKYILDNNIDIFVIGDDWKGKFDELNNYCKVIYLPRTKGISTTDTINKINYKKITLLKI